MTWTDKVGNLLRQYTSGGAAAAAQPAPDVHAHFDEVAQAAPPSVLAEGLTAAFNSDKTPAFGQMLSTLFNNSTGDQKAGIVNHLLSSVSPGSSHAASVERRTCRTHGVGKHAVDPGAGTEAVARSGAAVRHPCAKRESLSRRIGQQLLCPAHHTREDAGRGRADDCPGQGCRTTTTGLKGFEFAIDVRGDGRSVPLRC